MTTSTDYKTSMAFKAKRQLVSEIDIDPMADNFTELFAHAMFAIWGYPIELDSLNQWLTAFLIRETYNMIQPPKRLTY